VPFATSSVMSSLMSFTSSNASFSTRWWRF
jgi:hypothetical protein